MLLAAGFESLASGDPLAPQGFNPVQQSTIWPGDRLTVTCDFNSTVQKQSVAAGPTHEHEMCNMYLMVYSNMPHIEMCADGTGLVGDQSPGNLPKQAALVPDPYPLWKPFEPEDKTDDGKVRGEGTEQERGSKQKGLVTVGWGVLKVCFSGSSGKARNRCRFVSAASKRFLLEGK